MSHKNVLLEVTVQESESVIPHPPYFPVSPTEDKTERPSFWYDWGYRGRRAGGAEHPTT
jgi:hypothetical protein